jgi:cleavage and polyadenylation specificity factor subunit 1
VHPGDIQKTAITIPFGLFEFYFMSFGLRNAAQTFQRFMDDILGGLDFCFAYRDILVFSRSLEDHERHIRDIFGRLQMYGILINPAKCVFRTSEVTFLGYRVSSEGSRPLEERVAHLQDCPPPKTASQLRRFLGMLNFYRRFLPQAAAAAQAPLHDVLSGPRIKGSHPIAWTPELHKAFEKCKANLSRATLLAHPEPSAQLALVTDAFTSTMGAVQQQRVDNAWQPLAFFSKKLNPAQQKYSSYDRELLAVYEAVKYFRHMLEARHFIIFTDHMHITYVFQQKQDKCSPRQFNHLDFIVQFTTDIRHISGRDNVVADALSS